MYFTYSGIEKTVTLYAGQYMDVGTVTFTPSGDYVTITINLSGAVFADVYENLKIQDYAVAPTTKPAIGHFDWKYTYPFGETTASVTVPLAPFYGVHLDVAVEVPCPIIP
jgi:hypothetical protein